MINYLAPAHTLLSTSHAPSQGLRGDLLYCNVHMQHDHMRAHTMHSDRALPRLAAAKDHCERQLIFVTHRDA